MNYFTGNAEMNLESSGKTYQVLKT